MAIKKENSTSGNDDFVDWPHVGIGIYEMLEKAKQLFADASFLYENQKYESSIPLFIISLEEAAKAIKLAIKFRKYQSLTKDEWENLLVHKYKLVHAKKFVIETMEKGNKIELEKIKKEQLSECNVDIEQLVEFMKTEVSITSHFQTIKEKCLYIDWDDIQNEWDGFNKIDSGKQEDLAYYFMKTAELELERLHFVIEHAANVLRRDGKPIKNLPYPKYNEYRDNTKDYESIKSIKKRTRGEQVKYTRGERILKKFIEKKTFHRLYQEFTLDLLSDYAKLIQKHPPEQLFPHPIFRAISLASAASEDRAKDGNYSGLSGDAEETYDGQPMMLTMAIVSRKKNNITIEKVVVGTDEAAEYNIADKLIEKIFETELVIERFPGKEIPLEAAHEAFSKIGIKIRKLKDNEIESAITHTKKLINEGNYHGIPPDLLSQVENATKANWEDLDPLVRSIISSGYSILLPIEENQVIMSGYVDPIRKFKVRGLIYQTLKRNQFIANY